MSMQPMMSAGGLTTPVSGMRFETIDDVEQFVGHYAIATGTVLRRKTDRRKDQKDTITRVRFCCEHSGRHQLTRGSTQDGGVSKTPTTKKLNCPFLISVGFRPGEKKYVINTVRLTHNHAPNVPRWNLSRNLALPQSTQPELHGGIQPGGPDLPIPMGDPGLAPSSHPGAELPLQLAPPQNAPMIATRLLPKTDLTEDIIAVCEQYRVQAGFIGTCVGSLDHVRLRLAHAPGQEPTIFERSGSFEIVGACGTVGVRSTQVSQAGGLARLEPAYHVHLSVADEQGSVFGGHLLPGCSIQTTVELVISVCQGLTFGTPDGPADWLRRA
eukprot:gnl/Ergobibamus_cyprinoides/1005.p1 GENE.gnl/Ergobibamus_cyprinoides/1005~~gnl/Ergobibamus_cyprinoides/1005.p1  ORF type:complete len:326 (+),score=39.55 gnl/Ergobibamus_cyprinoides/1005:207-1184(+)